MLLPPCSRLVGGQICEDIDNYNRVHQMFFYTLRPGERRLTEFAEAFCMSAEAVQTLDRNALLSAKALSANNSSITVGFTPFALLFNQNK